MAAADLKECLDRRAELERRYPGWHTWVSDAGTKYATLARPEGGTTLVGETWADLEDQIAESTTPESPPWEI